MAFAHQSGMSEGSVAQILSEAAPITPEAAQRIASALGEPDADMWPAMQHNYDGWQASHYRKHFET